MIKVVRVCILPLIIFLALFINNYPNYYAFLKTPIGYDFSGQASWFDPWDINVYVSAIKWGQQGNILLENLYTSLPNNPILMYPLYTLSGYFNRNVNPFLLFHLLSLLSGIFLILIIWVLIKKFLDKDYQLVALFLIIFGGGFGSADLYVTSFTFVSQFQRAHEAIGIILYLISLVCFYLFVTYKKVRFNIFSLLSLTVLIFFYPYYIFSYILICGTFSLLKFLRNNDKIPIKFLLLNSVITLPILLIYYNHLSSNQTFNLVLNQKLSTPNIIEVLSGYGILFLLILAQLKSKKSFSGKLFLNLWFFISLFISYLPLGFARFYLRGLFFPLVILAIYGLIHLVGNSPKKIKVIILLLIILVPISTFFIFFKRIVEVKNNNPWYYVPKENINVLLKIPVSIPYNQSILTFYQMGNYIPTEGYLKVYFGHLIQTPQSSEKVQNLVDFYGNKYDDATALSFLKRNNIIYIFYGKEEQALTLQLSKSKKLKYSFLKPMLNEKDIIIFTY